MPLQTNTTGGAGSAVTTYWVVWDKATGKAVATTDQPTSAGVLSAVGATSASQTTAQSFTGSFLSGLEKIIGNFGLSLDQIPTKFSPHSGTNIMPLTSGISFAPFNTGSPLSPNISQSSATSTQQTFASVADLFQISNLVRLGEVILGFALLLLGLKAMTGGSGDPVQLITRGRR